MTVKTKQIRKTEPKKNTRKSPPRRHGRVPEPTHGKLGGTIGALAAMCFVVAGSFWVWSCSEENSDSDPTPAKSAARVQAVPPTVEPGAPSIEDGLIVDAGPSDATAGLDPDAPWEGPWVGALAPTSPVYGLPFRTRENLIGYLRHGTKAPANTGKPVKKDNCKQGWYQLHPHGYICGRHATHNLEDGRFTSGITPPDLDATVPYKYAYNKHNGTPLYRRIPTTEEMETYEPDRKRKAKKAKAKAEAKAETKKEADAKAEMKGEAKADAKADKKSDTKADAVADTKMARPKLCTEDAGPGDTGDTTVPCVSTRPAVPASATPVSIDAGLPPLPSPSLADILDAGSPTLTADAGILDAAEEPKPWWMQPDGTDEDLTLEHMFEGSDKILAQRMARGFFVAVDKTFRKNGRYWHKTTDGTIAPADKMSINSPPTFQGVELTGEGAPSLPLGWSKVKAAKHWLGEDGKTFRAKGTVDRFTMVPLTGKTTKRGTTVYRETKEGWWIRAHQIGVTDPGPPPAGLKPNERWIDINLTTQTLIALEGDKPVYATMISTGKKGSGKQRDRSTVKGAFRVREKHVAAKMDGDGAGPGEGPYSIRDVPYVLYFEGSYAIHGAFWHNNFGTRMSHGCVNLAPLDAKRIFFWSAPFIPEGWHGMWSTKEHPGSFVVVHD